MHLIQPHSRETTLDLLLQLRAVLPRLTAQPLDAAEPAVRDALRDLLRDGDMQRLLVAALTADGRALAPVFNPPRLRA